MSFKDYLNKKVLNEGYIHPMASDIDIVTDGEINITNKERRMYINAIGNERYFNTLGELIDYVLTSLKSIGIIPKFMGSEWTGSINGAMSDGEDVRLRFDIVKDNKDIKNSMLIIDIYKDNSRVKPYELTTYLS